MTKAEITQVLHQVERDLETALREGDMVELVKLALKRIRKLNQGDLFS